MDKINVLIEARPFCVFNNTPMELLENEGFKITDMRGSGIDNEDFVTALKSANVIICGNELHVDEELLKIGSQLKIIAKIGAGLDNIDITAATDHSVLICNTPGKNKQAVADHTFALILGIARRIVYCNQSLREKRWEQTQIPSYEIWQKTIGIVGLGAIGQNVALRAKGFRMNIVGYDTVWPEEFAQEHNIKRLTLEELLDVSDIVTLHLPLNKSTSGMIDKRALSLMKPTALLINTARGAIVKESDLCEALKNGVIAGAGIDVFENEPPTDSPLLELDNTILSPHTAFFTFDSINEMNLSAVEQIIMFYGRNQPQHAVNPEVIDSIQILRAHTVKNVVTA